MVGGRRGLGWLAPGLLALGLVLSACAEREPDVSAEGEATPTPEGAGGSEGEAEAEDPAGGGDAVPPGGGDECLVGSWTADGDQVAAIVVASVPSLPGVEPTVDHGTMTAEFRADHTADFVTQAGVTVDAPELGPVSGTMDGLMVVDWSTEGETLTYTTTSFDLTVAIDDLPLPSGPGPADGEQASVTYACEGDSLQLEANAPFMRLPANWTRTG